MDKFTAEHIASQARHTIKRSGRTWHVNAATGAANNRGDVPNGAFSTINQAIAVMGAGDRLCIARGAYDEAFSIGAALDGIEIICEPGVILSNTTPGTVVSIAADYVKFVGGVITQAGQIGMAVNGHHFWGEDIIIDAGTTAFDINSDHAILINCRAIGYTVTGFDIADELATVLACVANGTPATRGFYLSHTDAHQCLLYNCNSINNSGGAYECVAGADSNVISHCNQSELCGGPIDAGANNSWVAHNEESQIAIANTQQQDLADIHTIVANIQSNGLYIMDFWSDFDAFLQIDTVAGTETLPSVTVADLPSGATIVRAIAMLKFRKVENDNGANANSINGAQEIQVRSDAPGTWRNSIDLVDTMCNVGIASVEGGDVWIGDNDIAVEVDENDTYEFQWLNADANFNNLLFYDIQCGLRIWYRV